MPMQLLSGTKSLSFRWEHYNKQRYYQVHLGKDMFQDLVLTKVWGGIGKSNGRIVHVAHSSYAEAITELKKIIIVREKRGYLLVSGPCDETLKQ
jgi:predicted DNA-binding WGR domain protein